MIKNFLQHHKKLKGLRLGDLLHIVGEENGNATFLDELLKARSDPDIGDTQGRTPPHIATSKGHEECVMVLLRHGCSIHLQAAIKNDLTVMKELLKYGLQVNSKDRDGSTAIQVALEENLEDMVYLIRDVAANNLKRLAEEFGPEWAMQHIIPELRKSWDISSLAICEVDGTQEVGEKDGVNLYSDILEVYAS
ncbi:hypothetical protein HAX54_028981 [Datura stramonium]|uniref:Uncharacterized protein n=1 Tax=Datura stramonium TaxID=4076 RepID=A0ABS8V7Z6_DATST|nr:hypothetical protein [Datura stramonium]